MYQKETVELAKKIIELDLLRDQIWEAYASKAGSQAYELFRLLQNEKAN